VSQPTYTQSPAIARRGMITDDAYRDVLTIATAAALIPGRLVVRADQDNPDPIHVGNVPTASAADVDAIIVTGVSTAGIQTLDSTDFDGEVGAGYFPVPAFITFTFNSNANWDATNITVTGVLADGSTGTATIAIPDGGNATVTSTVAFWRITAVSIPAQSGTGGTFTMGIAATGRALTGAQILGVLVRGSFVVDGDTIDADRRAGAYRRGRICVETDGSTIVPGAPAFVRVVAGTATQLPGMFAATASSGAAVALTGARFTRSISSTLAEVNLDGGY
jgi:hypothetical protein